MSDSAIGFETLNAYVDGELSAAETAEAALAIAGDSLLARQVAALTRLRSAVIEAVETPAIEMPEIESGETDRAGVDSAKTGAPRARRPVHMYAACMSLLAVIVGSILVLAYFMVRPTPPAWFAEVAGAHALWAEGAAAPGTAAAGNTSSSLARAFVPDLTAAMLYVKHVVWRRAAAGGSLLVVGYRGTRGCQVTLTIFADGADFPAERILVRDAGRTAYAWRAGQLGYAIVADGMDPARFRLIVETVHATTLRNQPPNAQTQAALGASRRRSAPCLA